MTKTKQTPEPYRVAAVQFEPTLFDKRRNIEQLVALTEEAAASGARLIVHPEMATTGYCWASRTEIAPHVEPIPGPATELFGDVAARNKCYIVVGMPEIAQGTGIYYNSAALIGPDGLIGIYRKTHSYLSEPKWAKDGDLGIPVFDTGLGRIAITICMDSAYPESARVPALDGADVICFPTNWLSETCPSPSWMARALENGVYFLAANRYGVERGVQFSGGSCVIDPDGTIQSCQDSGDGIIYGTVDLATAHDKHWNKLGSEDKFADRRPDAYGAITLSTYRWRDQDFHGLYGLNPLPAGLKSRVGVFQFAPSPGSFHWNLEMISKVSEGHLQGEITVFPELSVTGPIESESDARIAGALQSEILQNLAAVATKYQNYLVVGFVELDGDRLFNAAALVGPDGVVGTYRKLHLTETDLVWATPGEDLKTFNIPAGRVGILIGYDAFFPESATCLALEGADLIACPSLVSGPAVLPLYEDKAHFHLWRERARETNTMIAFANGAAPHMGFSGVFAVAEEAETNPGLIVLGNGIGGVSLELDTTNLDTRYKTNLVRAKDYLAMRMPIWYDAIQRPVISSQRPQPAISS